MYEPPEPDLHFMPEDSVGNPTFGLPGVYLNLLAAIMNRAILDYVSGVQDPDPRVQVISGSAREWIFGAYEAPRGGLYMPFEAVCGALGLDPGVLRSSIQRRIQAPTRRGSRSVGRRA